jgi:chloramphenicol 3-O phosphotransferase
MAERAGRVIFLNGASSSGKSTIARELQKVLPDPYLHVSIDAFLHLLPAPFLDDGGGLARELPRLLAGFHASSAAIARAGNCVIVDTVLQEPAWIAPCVRAFEGLEVIFVAVRCSLETLESRESARGDRRVGMARYQYDRVHAHGVYDLEVDTSIVPLGECVSRILEYARSGARPTAFAKLAEVGRRPACRQGR